MLGWERDTNKETMKEWPDFHWSKTLPIVLLGNSVCLKTARLGPVNLYLMNTFTDSDIQWNLCFWVNRIMHVPSEGGRITQHYVAALLGIPTAQFWPQTAGDNTVLKSTYTAGKLLQDSYTTINILVTRGKS